MVPTDASELDRGIRKGKKPLMTHPGNPPKKKKNQKKPKKTKKKTKNQKTKKPNPDAMGLRQGVDYPRKRSI